jgi:hypothetical protein
MANLQQKEETLNRGGYVGVFRAPVTFITDRTGARLPIFEQAIAGFNKRVCCYG